LPLEPASDEVEKWRRILGVRFFVGSAREAVSLGLRGGLMVMPAAPLLVTSVNDRATQTALLESDVALPDSGLMVLYWNLVRRDNIPRVSGLEYLSLLLEEQSLRLPGAILWVMPNEAATRRNADWLKERGFPVSPEDFYCAPLYPAGPIADPALLQILEKRRPAHVIMAIGGGVQERLGYYLKQSASYRAGIHCAGAAIGFLNGDQVRIPTWGDRFFLGWLFRCFRSPATFIPRYWNARKLVSLIRRFGDRLPE
jgi:UDP-N-acetyl-D-mannosaminuronic acid transferase (WecB/TagA/CpsF family)